MATKHRHVWRTTAFWALTLRECIYACYEVGINVDVFANGATHIVGVDGIPLQKEREKA